ncbi:hypothetical protein E4U17_002574 [Claviceps sp. LM77 group G4]|nr:hypothetical protein E4U17_002574 [Claviceps sp. LM77 group G4]
MEHDGLFQTVERGEGESLEAYHGRILSIYRARGGRDKSVTPDQPQLTPLEVSSINEWIHHLKENMARVAAQQTRINLMEDWIRQHSGHSANEELSRTYRLPNRLFDACEGPRNQAVPVHFPPVPQQRYTYWPQQTNVSQFTPAPTAVSATAPSPASQLCLTDEYEEGRIAPIEHVGDSGPTVEAIDVSYAAVEPGVKPFPPQYDDSTSMRMLE